jgi:formamidopyrimidine-DNA glycosylase
MPELPEVEVTRLSFADRIRGAEVTAVRLGKPLRWPLGVEPQTIVAQKVGPVTRRGKYLWLPLDRGGRLMHLGMAGSLSFGSGSAPPGPHDHFDLVPANGTLRLTDPRRFGAVVWSPALDAGAAAKLLAGLGVEPFDPAFTGAHLYTALRRRRVAVKTALLGGDIVVGAGNIYACEALADAVRRTLARALESGGSTLRDFRDAHGMAGAFQLQARVYGRAGKACPRCGATIRRIVQGQRATFFCPGCQKR